MKKYSIHSILSAFTILCLSACGGGYSGSSAPTASNKCSIGNVSISSGASAELSKSANTLSTNFVLNLSESNVVEIISSFENINANDWIEALPYKQTLQAGNQNIALQYDLNSPKKNVADRYTKLNITVVLPNNEACVVNQAVNILLTL